MIRLKETVVQTINNAKSLEDLHKMLQLAVELEHAAIPTYLTAVFSLKPGKNKEIRDVIFSVVMEEMMHMSISSNILNALGGHPEMNRPNFIPKFPGPLPMGVGDRLKVSLEKYSPDLVKNVFMEIEEPEHPIDLMPVSDHEEDEGFNTIGQFYMAIKNMINTLADDQLPGDPKKQFTSKHFSKNLLFPILSKRDALEAIDIIIDQGEGSSKSPMDAEGDPSHYYRFEELIAGKTLVKDPSSELGYSFSGDPIPFDEDGVYNIFPNTKIDMLPDNSEEVILATQFAITYSELLDEMESVFNGRQDYFDKTLKRMHELSSLAAQLCSKDFPGKPGWKIGPTFEYISSIPI